MGLLHISMQRIKHSSNEQHSMCNDRELFRTNFLDLSVTIGKTHLLPSLRFVLPFLLSDWSLWLPVPKPVMVSQLISNWSQVFHRLAKCSHATSLLTRMFTDIFITRLLQMCVPEHRSLLRYRVAELCKFHKTVSPIIINYLSLIVFWEFPMARSVLRCVSSPNMSVPFPNWSSSFPGL